MPPPTSAPEAALPVRLRPTGASRAPSPSRDTANVLVLTADIGCGHGRAAAAVALHLRTHHPHLHTRILDALTLCPRWFTLAYRDLYLFGAKHLPRLSGRIYDLSDRPARGRSLAHRLESCALRRLIDSPELTSADLIITTHFLTARVLSHLRGTGQLKARLAVIVTDQHPHAVWRVAHADLFCIASQAARQPLLRDGLPADRIRVTGIPIDARFHEPLSKVEARLRHALPLEKPIVLLSGGGLGLGGIDTALEALLTTPGQHHPVVVCGKNPKLHQQLTHRYGRATDRLTLLGHTTRMHELMAAADLLLGKPGGLTTSEAAARGLPMVLLKPLPGQEQHNAAALTAAGVARLCPDPAAAGRLAAQLVTDAPALAAMQAAALRFAPPAPADAVVHHALSLIGSPTGRTRLSG